MPRTTKNLSGKKFGKVTAISSFTRTFWTCRCECGRVFDVRMDAVQKLTSCGCDRRRTSPKATRRHGMSHLPEALIWRAILGRCTNKNHSAYGDYGGRGIFVCDRWLTDFLAFYEDMGPRPSLKHSVERRDNDGDYSPTNCFWATPDKQSNNRRNSVRLTHDGKTQTVAQWADELTIDRRKIYQRLDRGWSTEAVLTATN
jgi:hypothetical protein